ncbi:MAG TPA: GNAT family protein [Jatrophihabitantaceae bacterium]|jgi:RimJ/RimL family protein N-acetyltransferase
MLTLSLDDGAEMRALEPWHADEFAAHVDEIRDHIKPWVPFAHRVIDADSARQMLQYFADQQANGAGRMFGIWLEGRLSGGTLFPRFDAGLSVCEIGAWLAPWAEGRGLITAAARHMIDWAITVRGMARVEWNHSPDNERSRAVAQRLGMTNEGVRRSDFVVGEQRQDSEGWAMLATDWPAVRAQTIAPHT